MTMIEITDKKVEKLSEHIEESLRSLGKAMQCVEQWMEESEGMGERGSYGQRGSGGSMGSRSLVSRSPYRNVIEEEDDEEEEMGMAERRRRRR